MSCIPGEAVRPEIHNSKSLQLTTAESASARWRVRGRALGLAVLLLAATGARAQAVFSPLPVGAISGAQGVTVTAQAAGTVHTVELLTMGVSGLDFAAGGGAQTCAGAALAKGGTCTLSVTFTPASPGIRMGAAVLLDAGGNVLATTYLSGTGQGGLGILIPGNVIPVAGDGQWVQVDDGKIATKAELNLPAGVTVDGAGNLYIADSLHYRIRKVDAKTGLISTVAGNGNPAYTGDNGLAVNATLNSPNGVAIDGAGNLYIADTGNNVIRKITAATGIITTVAGTGIQGSSGDSGLATLATLNQPWGVTLDGSGNLFIADTANHRVRRVDAVTGIVTNVAGTGFTYPDGSGDFAGDGGKATLARLNRPYAVAFDSAGDMYIPDSANDRVRMVNAAGNISTLAGTGTVGFSGDGAAANQAELWAPSGVAVDPAGNVYIADTQNNSIRKVSSATGFITTIVRNGTGEYYYGQQFLKQNLYGPIGLSLDAGGNLFFADYYDMMVREIQGNYAALDFTAKAVRQGDKSTPLSQVLENDGNEALDLTAIVPDANAALDGATTTCTTGNPFLVIDKQCTIGAIFAPTTAGNPLAANIDVGKPGDTINAPLDIQLIGDATAVNSTTIAVASNPNPSGFGQAVTFTATVTTGAGTGSLTGTVSFFNGAATLASGVALNSSGVATFQISTLSVGKHTITASYSGDASHFSSKSTDNSTAPLIQIVLEATSTILVSSLNPSSVGQSVTFTATVAASGGGGVIPDGTVTFTDGPTTLGTVALNASGVAAFSTSALANGLHPITASYSGDLTSQILSSASPVLNQDVLMSSAIGVVSSSNPSFFGSPVVFTATVSSAAAAPATGTVKFLDGAVQIGTGTLAGNPAAASYTAPSLSVGAHTITATYAGDNYNGPSSSPAFTQTVNKTQTSSSVGAAPNPGIAGAPVAITATVTVISGAGTPTGTVTFTNGAATLGSAAVGAGGTATINPVLAPGSYSIVATYSGDGNDNGSASTPLALTVIQATTQTAVTATPNPSIVGTAVTFTAKVTGNGGIPTGSVTFSANGTAIGAAATLDATGTGTITYSGLVAGSYTIKAVYGGDTNNLGSTGTGSAQLIVGTIPTVTTLGTATTSGPNAQVILVASVTGSLPPTPTGTVTFNNGVTVVGTSTLNASGIATLVPNLATGTYTIVAVYGGDPAHSPSTSQPVTISTGNSSFDITLTPPTITMKTSQNSTVTVTMTSSNGFTDTIGLGCASLPAGVTCHFAPISVTLAANGTATDQLTIDTNNPLSGGASAMNKPVGGAVSLAGMLLPFSLFFGWLFLRLRKRHASVFATALALVLSAAALMATGCNGFTSNSAAPGTYVIQITGTGANSNVIHYQNVTLTITN